MKSMKKFAEPHKSLEKILEKMWHFFVCFDALVVGALSLSPEDDFITKTCHNFQEFLDEEELCPARFFIDFMLQNVIQNWKMKNFHE